VLEKNEEKVFNKLVGQRIKNARESSGVKQEVLANYLGFKSRISITNIESGRQNIQLTTLVEIADYLKTPLEDLIPSIDVIKKSVSQKLVKSIAKDGIADVNARERIKDFIRYTATKK